MKKSEYIKTLVIGKNLIVVGLDDAGQTYFFEYLDKDGVLKEECCGAYNLNYERYIEYKFGNPELECEYYKDMEASNEDKNCPDNFKYGYCDKCVFQNREWSNYQYLISLGIIDRRGNVNEKYSKFLKAVEEENQ